MPFTFEKAYTKDGTLIDGLFTITPKVFADTRGYFLETYSKKDFTNAGIDAAFVQDNESKSNKGVLRGLHFQKQFPQGKLIRVIEGEVFDVAVDIRKGSATFGKWYSVNLSAEKHNQFFVPPGFAHGFLVLSPEALFVYKCTEFYHPEDEGGIIYNDASLAIEWPVLDLPYILSEKDKNHPPLGCQA